MENYLKQLNHRYIKYPDESFSFSLLKSNNFFYLYLDTNNINGNLKFDLQFKETPLNPNPKSIPNICTSKLLLCPDEIIFKTLFEGIWERGIFYLTDIHVHNGILVNHNYKTRYLLLKKILESFNKNQVFSIMKVFSGINLEYLITDIIPQQTFKAKFILMQKNFMQYILNVEENEPEKIQKKQKLNIEQFIERPIQERCKVKIFKTQKTEIYLVEHKKHDFFTFGSFWKTKFETTDIFYSVLRVPDIKSSQYLKSAFDTQKFIETECIYNSYFKKFEFRI